MKKILNVFGILFICLLLIWLIAGQVIKFRMDDEELKAYFQANKLSIKIGKYPAIGRTIRYVSVGNDSLPTLILIHGAPSSLTYFNSYLIDKELLSQFKIIAIDRPGYGYTSGFGTPETSIEKQAAAIRPLLDSLRTSQQPVIVLGSSYGTSIACRLVMDNPDKIDGLILSAPSLAPNQEHIYAISYLLENPLMAWFTPDLIHLADAEKFAHESELTKMLPLWSKIQVPVSYLQGQNDQLIYTSNATFAQKMLGKNLIHLEMIPNEGHFIAIPEKEKIKKAIFEVYKIGNSRKEN